MLEIKTAPKPSLPPGKSASFNGKLKATIEEAKQFDAYVEGPDGMSLKTIPFILMHVACITVLFVGISWTAVLLCVGLCVVRLFGLPAGYHRFFPPRS